MKKKFLYTAILLFCVGLVASPKECTHPCRKKLHGNACPNAAATAELNIPANDVLELSPIHFLVAHL